MYRDGLGISMEEFYKLPLLGSSGSDDFSKRNRLTSTNYHDSLDYRNSLEVIF